MASNIDREEANNIESFLRDIQDYPPPIPDSVIMHILAEAGLNTTDPRVHRTMNVVCQKFMSEVLSDCSKIASSRVKSEKKKKLELQVYDLKQALEPRGIHIHRPEFIVSIPPQVKD